MTTIGILSPGDMGHVVGRVLAAHGARVITCLEGRSQRSKALAAAAGMSDVPTYAALVSQADIVLSIVPPAEAAALARTVAAALKETGATPLYADCNAVAPQTALMIESIITPAGGRFVDASIIGPPPRKEGITRIYAAGPHAPQLAELNAFGLHVIVLSDRIGQAKAIKMCYSALIKGLSALSIELVTAAQAMGVAVALRQEFERSEPILYAQIQRLVPNVPMKARRFVGEMEEMAKTFEHVGLTPKIPAGAADLYRFVGQTSLAQRSPEDPQPLPSLWEVAEILSAQLAPAPGDAQGNRREETA
jgi:3-hydroxyisobutyrate dehydrogenase-like beta-hydroxyacid dehydrogenase